MVQRSAAALMFLPLALVLLAGCKKEGAWPKQGLEGFVAGCVEAGGAKGTCECMGEELQKAMTWQEFTAFTAAAQGGQMPSPEAMKKVEAATMKCNAPAK